MGDINSWEIVAVSVTAWRKGAAGPSLFPAALGIGGGGHRRGELFGQAEKMLHPFPVARERLLAIEPVDRLVERAVRLRRSSGMTSGS